MHTPVLLSLLVFPPMDENLHDNVIGMYDHHLAFMQACHLRYMQACHLAFNTFAFRSGRITLVWKDREYSFRFQGFLSNLTKNVILVSHVL